MPNGIIDINSNAVVVYAAKLETYGKARLPVAARQTLNAAALDVKQKTMPATSDAAFHKRKPTFFGATSGVEFAKGLDINNMSSVVGFIAPASIKESGHATRDLEEQEGGGRIDKRAFIAADKGRTGRGNVKDSLTLAKIKPYIIDANKELGKNSGEKFIRAAMKAGYPNGFVLGTNKNSRGNRALMQIISIHKMKGGERSGVRGGNTVVNSKAIYSVKGKRQAHVHATHFMEKATAVTTKKMPAIFNELAEKAFNK